MSTLFIFEVESCKNFTAVFLKTLFFKSSTSNVYMSESFALRRLREVSIDSKFYLVLGSGHNSIPQKWDLFRWMYTYVYTSALLFKYCVEYIFRWSDMASTLPRDEKLQRKCAREQRYCDRMKKDVKKS